MLSDKALKELKEIFLEEIGENISDEFAMEQGLNLLSAFNETYRPIKSEWLEVGEKPIDTFKRLSLELQKIVQGYKSTFYNIESSASL